jgi:putative SOS response-associated peptidase YedK
MCGRYTLTNPDPLRLRARFDILESVEGSDEPRFNIAPTDPVLAVRELEPAKRELGRLRWGLVPGKWAEKKGEAGIATYVRDKNAASIDGLPGLVSR